MTTFVTHSGLLTLRSLRSLLRMPAYLLFTLVQPMVWLLLFGQLFQRVAELPGFGGGSYLEYLTPGVIVMTAMMSAGWNGTSFIQDMERGVMDRNLTSPVSRGALISGSLAYQAVTTVVQSLIVFAVGLAAGARYAGGPAGVLVVLLCSVLLALIFAALSDALALLFRQQEALIGVSQFLTLPLAFLSSVMMAPAVMPGWVGDVARFNPVDWAAVASRQALSADPDWAAVFGRAGLLTAVAVLFGWLASRAFRAYQRSA
ncbi:ABC transporter permease [Prauserella muralis]|uniref:Transport permease protein n=1 Tax=Prauserella muralis TaxID=588067 RepID=A0A2V4AKA3_9PSEU|nr:ABC transporter permease [Prauserella muralis]PXY20718.1 multidrug ABC transporter permease [Prauserella muralis]TWE29725.1 ABC-2 type transport system permease protein [Prauserella muralis]